MEKEVFPCGLVINIAKNTLGTHQKDDCILGYYDRLDINSVEHWLDYSPRNTSPDETDSKARPLSFYPIKLIFPAQDLIANLEKRLGLDYNSWKDFSSVSGEKTQRLESKLLQDYPCVTVALVNLTDQFKGDLPRDVCNNLLQRFVEAVGRFEGKHAGVSLKDAHCCVLPTLGYSDYCILLAEKSWRVAPLLMEYLHSTLAESPEGEVEVPVLSTDYVIPVYRLVDITKVSGGEAVAQGGPEVRLSVRVNLLPGTSMMALEQKVQEYADVYQISGESDCLLVSKSAQDLNMMLRMLTPQNEEGDSRLAALTLSTEAFLQRRIGNGATVETAWTPKRPQQDNSTIENLRKTLQEYGEQLIRGKRHMRQLHAIYDQLSVIQNICSSSHNQSLQQIMKDWLEAFDDCMKRCVRDLKTLSDSDVLYATNDWRNIEKALSLFIDEAGSFLADLSRSDCFFMESEQYNHPSVGSATALLIAYNRWQNGFARAVMGDNQASYSFLVRSGGCDSTHTQALFGALCPDICDGNIQERLPLITQMSEMGLFDCGGSIFRMAHECMHYCGKRQRKKRAVFVIRFTASYYARMIAKGLFSRASMVGSLVNRLRELLYSVDEVTERELTAVWKQQYDRFQNTIQMAIQNELEQALERDKKDWDELDYMARKFQVWLKNRLTELFSCYQATDDTSSEISNNAHPFVRVLYTNQHQAARCFFEGCDTVLHGYDEALRVCMMEARRLRDLDQRTNGMQDTPPKDWPLAQSILFVLNQLLIRPGKTQKKDGAYALRQCNIYTVLGSLIFDCFSETFADVSACLRLKPLFSDYILAFVFESWNLGAAGTPAIYRIPPVLKLCFEGVVSNTWTLEEPAKRQLYDAVIRLEDHGMPQGRINPEVLIEQIEWLLKQYEEVRDQEGRHLEDYLKLCVESYDKERNKKVRDERLRPYREVFERVRLTMKEAKSKENPAEVSLRLFGTLISTQG